MEKGEIHLTLTLLNAIFFHQTKKNEVNQYEKKSNPHAPDKICHNLLYRHAIAEKNYIDSQEKFAT